MAFDRYAYGFNNSLRYTDPSGHNPCYGIGDPATREACSSAYRESEVNGQLTRFGITTIGYNYSQKLEAVKAAQLDGKKWQAAGKGNSPEEAFIAMHGNVTLEITGAPVVNPFTGETIDGNCLTIGGHIQCETAPTIPNTIHEFGHAFDNAFNLAPSSQIPIGDRTTEGYECHPYQTCLEHPFATGEEDRTEELADFYLNWVLDGVPGYDNYGLTNQPTDLYGDYTRAEWWYWNIVLMYP